MERHTAESKRAKQQIKDEKERRRETGRAQRSSEHLIQTIIDTIEGEVFVKDRNGKYLYVNRAFGKDFQVDPKDVTGKDDYFIFSPDAAAKLQENDKRIMAAKKAESVEEGDFIRGKNRTYLTNKVPLIGEDGNVIGICGVGFDITQQKKIEKALKDAHLDLERKVKERTAQLTKTVEKLREAELRYRTVADFTYDWEYWTKLDGTLQYVSPSCERIAKLQNYSWPGNVRELENVIQRAVINTEGDKLQLADDLQASRSGNAKSADLPIKSLKEVEREHILAALRKTNWKIQGESGAAALLEINSSTLRARMRKLGIHRPPYRT